MNTHEVPITWTSGRSALHQNAVEPCFGLGCERRGACRCYHAVESAPGGSTTRASCLRYGQYPEYACTTESPVA